MRVLQLVQKPQRRGAEVFAHQLSQWLRGQGHEVRTVYLYGYDGEKSLQLEPGDLGLGAAERHPFELVPGVQVAVLRRLREFVRDFAPNIVQLNGARTIKYGAALKAIEGRPAWKMVYRNIDSPVFWVRGTVRGTLYKRWIMPRVDAVVGVSRQTLREVEEFYRLAVPQVFIPNGVDFSGLTPGSDRAALRARLDTPVDAVVALFMGNLTQQKRPDRFLRVLARATAENTRLYGWLLGDGPDRVALEAQVAELGLGDRVRFLGYQEQVAPFVAATDLYVSTSDTEGIPAVVLEVGYLGKPTVGMRVGGMHECVLDGETGYLVPPGDENALARVVTTLAADAPLRQRLGVNARAWTRSEFSIGRVGEQYEQFYESLLPRPALSAVGR
jgi:glycosyltransferase involved in cell wall biosynthesis